MVWTGGQISGLSSDEQEAAFRMFSLQIKHNFSVLDAVNGYWNT